MYDKTEDGLNSSAAKSIEIRGDWDIGKIEKYLQESVYPMRLSCITSNGFPLVVSLWFLYREGTLWCAVQKDCALARILKRDDRCGFEVSPNETPYLGVRGQGRAELVPDAGADKLRDLIDRYLDESNKELADWLLTRSDNETAIRITPQWFYSWDFSGRMK
jgi:nitroimidazol reductase NimA-like FMN-containing flavoprotein (pyridoxamine 5'-phosphate oxidase superfamily)